MGLFGKLFEKKECAICGGEIGLLGNRKLEDGNMCKECAKLLSPWMTDRRQSTVEEIKRHLQYREENKRAVNGVHPTRVIGANMKVYVDEEQQKFFVTAANDWQNQNPDIIDISQVTACNLNVRENKKEIYRKTSDGKRESYNPPRYEFSYQFMIDIQVNSPWFSEIEFELSGIRPDSPHTEMYREYERQANELQRLLEPGRRQERGGVILKKSAAAAAVEMAAPAGWVCPQCGAKNEGKFCENCGAKRPEPRKPFQCGRCGWAPEDPASAPKFCPECGSKIEA